LERSLAWQNIDNGHAHLQKNQVFQLVVSTNPFETYAKVKLDHETPEKIRDDTKKHI